MSYLDLKKIRKDLQITQDRLAELCGITRRTLINWEKNPDNIPYASAQFLMSLADGASTGDNPTPDGSKLLGHTDVKTTQIYAKIMDERKTEAVDALAGFYERKEEGQRPSLPSETT